MRILRYYSCITHLDSIYLKKIGTKSDAHRKRSLFLTQIRVVCSQHYSQRSQEIHVRFFLVKLALEIKVLRYHSLHLILRVLVCVCVRERVYDYL